MQLKGPKLKLLTSGDKLAIMGNFIIIVTKATIPSFTTVVVVNKSLENISLIKSREAVSQITI